MSYKKAALATTNRSALTFNGAATNYTSTDALVDLFFLIGASRGKDLTQLMNFAIDQDLDLATRLALWARDVRGGAGERQQFRTFLKLLESRGLVEHLIKVLPLVPEVGRWDDLLIFSNLDIKGVAYYLIARALQEGNGLCAKWMPRKGPIAVDLTKALGVSPKQYRKILVERTNVVEQKMCAKQWDEIDFSKLPSLASARYAKAFNKNAPQAYAAYKNALKKGDPTVKVNAGAVYPYDIIKGMMTSRDNDAVYEAQWAALPNWIAEGKTFLPICDTSGSMSSHVDGMSNITHLHVCVSLGLYLAHKQKGPFSNMFMTFSNRPRFQFVKGVSLRKDIETLAQADWEMNTNLEAAFELVLKTAVDNDVRPEDMPSYLLILSDMEFDSCATPRQDKTLFEVLGRKYEKAGYELPKVVFWNLNGRQGNSPVTVRDNNVALVSGFSPSIMRSVLSAKKFTPRDVMLETIMADRYDYQARWVNK